MALVCTKNNISVDMCGKKHYIVQTTAESERVLDDARHSAENAGKQQALLIKKNVCCLLLAKIG